MQARGAAQLEPALTAPLTLALCRLLQGKRHGKRNLFFFILQNLLNTIIPHLICHYSSQHMKNIFFN